MTSTRSWVVLLFTTSIAVTAGAAGCGDSDSGSIEIECGEGASAALTAGGEVVVSGGAAMDLEGAAVAADTVTTPPADTVTIACADDIAPEGFVPLGPAVTFGPEGSWSDRPFTFTLPFKSARLPEGAGLRNLRIVARRHVGDGTPFFPPVSNRSVDDEDPYASRVSFRGGEMVTYQVVAAEDAGQPYTRRYTFRAIVGISMGGNASLSIGLRNHEEFDLIGDLGGEPGPSMKYSLSFIREYLFGGFCTAADQEAGHGDIGELCTEQQRPVMADQFERKSDYEHMLYEEGEGVGLTLNRDLYMKAARDLGRALGNPALYNADDPYLPPGVPASFLEMEASARCSADNAIVLDDFYDANFNPDATHPVITYCDGGDSPTLGLGVFDPSLPQDNPAEVFLAVDLDADGVRDAGEPVIVQPYEPFEDVGSDGVASADEPGYDAATNPDPNGDDYHYLRNPRGTEGNWDRDEGEPYDDFGLDGIQGTCQQGDTPPNGVAGCYDYGEGDGEWTLSPNLARWYQSDLDELYAAMTDTERRRINIWMDAGIRDFLNAVVSANVGSSLIMGEYGLPGAVWDSFHALQGVEPSRPYDFAKVDWDNLPPNQYMRYGNPDATAAQIEAGDGRHVGTAIQLINRATTAFAWLDAQWPSGHREPTAVAGQILEEQTFTAPSTGRETPYALFLPPGYDNPDNADKTYPVVYFLHGYGQEPDDLVQISAVFENYMNNPDWLPEERFQKFIIVYVDGRCRPTRDGVPVDPSGDQCERGTFYMDSPLESPAQMETNMLELMDYIDENYRTRPPEEIEVIR